MKKMKDYLRDFYSLRGEQGEHRDWAKRQRDQRHHDATEEELDREKALYREDALTSSLVQSRERRGLADHRVDAEDYGTVAHWMPFEQQPTWKDQHHQVKLDDNFRFRSQPRMSPPGGFLHPPAVVRTANTAPV